MSALLLAVFLAATSAPAQLFNFTTLAGSATSGSANGSGTNAEFNNPVGVAVDSFGNIFVADADNDTIRKIAPDGTVTTFAGSPGIPGNADGVGTNALFNAPQAVAVDRFGNVLVSDTGNDTIREINPDGTVKTLAGSPGLSGSTDGTGTNAQFFSPHGIAVDASDDVFVADTFNDAIRKITPDGTVSTLAGSPGFSGSADGTGGKARFNRPTGVAIDEAGNLFVSDLFNHTIREIAPDGTVSTIAGLAGVFGDADGTNSAARFFEPEDIAFDGTNLFVADAGNHSIRELSPTGTNWVVSTIAGWPGHFGNADGSGIAARFFYPAGLTTLAGKVFVADSGNNVIRAGTMITNHPPTILSEPQSRDVNAGNAVTFNVGAIGSAILYYQWQFNGDDIPGATGTNYTLVGAQPSDAGDYSVVVTSSTGSASSSNAVLTIYPPPTISQQPVSQVALQGATVSFTVAAGPPPLTYQWQKNGKPLADSANVSGTATATLTLSNVTTAAAASYSVLVDNGHGAVASAPATLTVFAIPPPDSIRPVAWWRLDEGTGTEAFDYSGNGHNGTLNAGATWTGNGHSGNGVYFNATSTAKIVINNPFVLSGNWTATMWANRWETKPNAASSVLLGGVNEALKLEQYQQTNHVGYTVYGKNDYPLNYVTPLNAWVHLAFVKSSAGLLLYADGALVASLNLGTASLDVTTLGCDRFTDYLDATLDEVRIYDQALTAQQITNLFAYGRISPIPAITLTSPTNDQSFIVSTNIALAADVVSNAQNLVRVEFYSGTNRLGQAAVAPYRWTWTNVLMGNYSLTARAVFNGTNTVDSTPVDISVAPATNRPTILAAATNGTLRLSWPPDHTGWRLQAQTNPPDAGLTTNWTDLSNSTATNRMVVPVVPTNGSVFYRMIYR